MTELATPRTEPGQRRTPALVGTVWALLVINTLGSQGAVTIIPIPRPIAQMITMGSMIAALGIALLLNPRLKFRPSAFLLLMGMLLVVSVASSVQLKSGYGALFRCFRLSVFIATLWLLSPWWNNAMVFVRHHIRVLCAVLTTVALGLLAAPGLAFPDVYSGRLVGVVWPLTPPQIGQYAAVVTGLTLLLWMGKRTDKWSVLAVAVPALTLLMLSHTRTATIGLVGALVVAILSLLLTSARARRVFTWTAVTIGVSAVVLLPAIQAWLRRGQDEQNLASLTGRATVWEGLLAAPRTTAEQLFGVGLTNKSFNGLPIDNSWLSVYNDQGLIGVALVAIFLATLLVVAALRPPSLERACAIFLIVYCVMASYTEAGLGDASPYLLNLAVAAALLSKPRTPAMITPSRATA
jgi:hypothetical protein